MKHPHDAEIRALLDGKTVQVMNAGKWVDVEPLDYWIDVQRMPAFPADMKVRIRPETIRYRVALWKVGAGKTTPVTCLHGEYDGDAQNPNFIRWLGDEQEVEV